jgi:hypothetical protein
VYMFTDNSTVESCASRGSSSSPKLLDLVIRLQGLMTRSDVRIHIFHSRRHSDDSTGYRRSLPRLLGPRSDGGGNDGGSHSHSHLVRGAGSESCALDSKLVW